VRTKARARDRASVVISRREGIVGGVELIGGRNRKFLARVAAMPRDLGDRRVARLDHATLDYPAHSEDEVIKNSDATITLAHVEQSLKHNAQRIG